MTAVLIGGVAVSLLGVSPGAAFAVYFVTPLSELWSLQEIAVKAAPMMIPTARSITLPLAMKSRNSLITVRLPCGPPRPGAAALTVVP